MAEIVWSAKLCKIFDAVDPKEDQDRQCSHCSHVRDHQETCSSAARHDHCEHDTDSCSHAENDVEEAVEYKFPEMIFQKREEAFPRLHGAKVELVHYGYYEIFKKTGD